MKIGIDNPIRNISSNIASHRSAWAYLWRELLIDEGHDVRVIHDGESWEDGYDAIASYWGMEFNGSPNMFDGLSSAVFERMDRYVRYAREGMRFINLEVDIGDLFLRRMRVRVGNGTTDPRATPEWIENLFEVMKLPEKWTQFDLKPRNALVIGDSHSISTWRPGAYCRRMDGKTLRGLTKTLVADALPFLEHGNVESITINAGNIDIRHHLFRPHEGFEGPVDYLEDTLKKYVEQIKVLGIPDVELVHALPIEDESRHLRKSVCLDDTPFTGSRKERADIAEYFNNRIDEIATQNGWRVHRWPPNWYAEADADPMSFFNYMEKPYSVHLSREFYRWKPTYQDPPRVEKKRASQEPKSAKYKKKEAPVQIESEDIWA